MTPLDYMLAMALTYAGLRAAREHAHAQVADAHNMLIDSLGNRGIVRMRAATLAVRALMMALVECDAANVSPLARSLARAEALTSFRSLLDGEPPPDPRAELARAWAGWRRAADVPACLALAHAALRVGVLFVDTTPATWPIGDLTGRQIARELGRADLLGEAEGPGPVAVAPDGPVAPAGRAPRARLEVV